MTKILAYIVAILRQIIALLDKIPVVDIALYWVARICYFIFDELFMAIGSIIALCKGNGEYGRFKKSNAIMLDKKLNVSGQYIFNALFIKGQVPDHLKFGNEFSTISDQMGRLPSMTKAGSWSKDVLLDTLEDEHCAKAVQLNNNALIKRVKELQLL